MQSASEDVPNLNGWQVNQLKHFPAIGWFHAAGKCSKGWLHMTEPQ
jgi:hypothetical protein